jgi:hypothetical protein
MVDASLGAELAAAHPYASTASVNVIARIAVEYLSARMVGENTDVKSVPPLYRSNEQNNKNNWNLLLL